MLCIVLGSLLPPVGVDPARAEVMSRMQGEGISIHYDSPLRENAEILLRAYPGMRKDLEGKLGWKLRTKPVVFLVGSSAKFREMGGGRLDAALTVFPKGHIVMNFDTATPHLFLLNITFRHELCHVLLHEHIAGQRLPKWLDEGVSEWASDTAEEDFNSRLERVAMAYALSRRAVPLEEISRSFPPDSKGRTLSYEQSRSFIRFITERYGREALLQVLEQLKNGAAAEQAFKRVLSDNLATVEAQWREDNLRRVRWILIVQDLVEKIREQVGRMWTFAGECFRKIQLSFHSARPSLFLLTPFQELELDSLA